MSPLTLFFLGSLNPTQIILLVKNRAVPPAPCSVVMNSNLTSYIGVATWFKLVEGELFPCTPGVETGQNKHTHMLQQQLRSALQPRLGRFVLPTRDPAWIAATFCRFAAQRPQRPRDPAMPVLSRFQVPGNSNGGDSAPLRQGPAPAGAWKPGVPLRVRLGPGDTCSSSRPRPWGKWWCALLPLRARREAGLAPRDRIDGPHRRQASRAAGRAPLRPASPILEAGSASESVAEARPPPAGQLRLTGRPIHPSESSIRAEAFARPPVVVGGATGPRTQGIRL
jgi:hypothetical protein